MQYGDTHVIQLYDLAAHKYHTRTVCRSVFIIPVQYAETYKLNLCSMVKRTYYVGFIFIYIHISFLIQYIGILYAMPVQCDET